MHQFKTQLVSETLATTVTNMTLNLQTVNFTVLLERELKTFWLMVLTSTTTIMDIPLLLVHALTVSTLTLVPLAQELTKLGDLCSMMQLCPEELNGGLPLERLFTILMVV
jgi:hypothetical protein